MAIARFGFFLIPTSSSSSSSIAPLSRLFVYFRCRADGRSAVHFFKSTPSIGGGLFCCCVRSARTLRFFFHFFCVLLHFVRLSLFLSLSLSLSVLVKLFFDVESASIDQRRPRPTSSIRTSRRRRRYRVLGFCRLLLLLLLLLLFKLSFPVRFGGKPTLLTQSADRCSTADRLLRPTPELATQHSEFLLAA